MLSLLKALWAKIVAEPTAVAGILSLVVPVLVGFHIWWLTADELAVAVVFVEAVLAAAIAVTTKHPTLPVFLGVVTALSGLCAAYGLHWSAALTALVIGAVTALTKSLNWVGTGPKYGAKATAKPLPFESSNPAVNTVSGGATVAFSPDLAIQRVPDYDPTHEARTMGSTVTPG